MTGRVTDTCLAVIDGTSPIADNGKVMVTYTNSTDQLTVLNSGSNLHFYMSGCSALHIHSGDHAAFSGSYPVIPAQTITSP